MASWLAGWLAGRLTDHLAGRGSLGAWLAGWMDEASLQWIEPNFKTAVYTAEEAKDEPGKKVTKKET